MGYIVKITSQLRFTLTGTSHTAKKRGQFEQILTNMNRFHTGPLAVAQQFERYSILELLKSEGMHYKS